MSKIRTDSGLTVAILSVLVSAQESVTTRDMVEAISGAGRRVTIQEVSSLMVSVLNSQVKDLLEIGKMGRTNTYRLKPEYRRATVEQVQRVYLKRVRYTKEDLYQDLQGGTQRGTPIVTPTSLPMSPPESSESARRGAGENTGDSDRAKHRLTIILDNRDTELTIKYQ